MGLNSANVLGLDQLLELTLEPNWADLDLDNRRALVVDLGDLPPDSAEAETLSRWFRNQPIPIVGMGKAPASVDLLVTENELDRAIACIDRNPQAAAVLVQVLRSTATLNVVDALTMESLAYATLQGGTEFANWLGGNRAAHPPRDSEANQAVLLDRLSDRLGDRLEVVAGHRGRQDRGGRRNGCGGRTGPANERCSGGIGEDMGGIPAVGQAGT